MAVLPTLLFAVPALFGHPAIAQDNLIQNFPLRVLTGQELRSGHLPLLNPFADSGVALLGGMNAGSFFPLTFLFVALPSIMAWVLNLIAVYVASAVGMFALLRWHGLRTYAALVPALVYTYSGAMMGQLVHVGVVQGYALLPWTLLALFSLAQALERAKGESWRGRVWLLLPAVTGIAVLWGLTALTGEPRAIAEMQLLLLIAGPVLVFVRSPWQPTSWRDRLTYVVAVSVGVMWGIVIGLSQLLPGWAVIGQSQRTGLNYQWYGAGSLATRWTSLMFIPDVFGGNGVLHQPNYFITYNLPEVTGYVGLLALVALFAYLTRLSRRGWRGADREWIVYFALVVVGLFATWGSYTPLGHVFQHIPLYGSTRLQSRNIIIVDLGLTALLGWFLQRLGDGDVHGAGLTGHRRWLTLSPALVTALLSFSMLFYSNAIVDWMTSSRTEGAMAHFERPTLVLHLLVALGVLTCLLWQQRRPAFMKWITAVVVADMLIFLTFGAVGFVAGRSSVEPSRAHAVAALGANGRFALVDPSGSHHDTFVDLGGANLNVFTGLGSVQGYGSLIDQHYGTITFTHPLFGLDGCQLARNIYHQLRLSSVVVSWDKLATLVTPTMTRSSLCVALHRSTVVHRYFGNVVPVRSVTIEGPGNRAVATGPVTARLLNARGRAVGVTISEPASSPMVFDFSGSHEQAAGVQITSPTGTLITSTVVRLRGANAPSYQLDSAFQQALTQSTWRLRLTSGGLSYFRATTLRPSAWIASHTSASRITNVRNTLWGDSWVSVRGDEPTTIKRSMEWIPGWRATAVNDATGVVTTLHVVRSGLIQQVEVPAGRWTIHFHYHAPHIEIGLIASMAGSLLALASIAAIRGWVPRRRKGKDRVNS